MDLGLKGKCALVLASSSGLGFASANALAAEGATVAVCSRDQARANEAAHKIKSANGAEVFAYEVDVAKAESLEILFQKTISDLGSLDILICNAGGPPPGSFSALDEDKWDLAYQLTLQSVVRSVRHALPHFQASGGGSILVIGSSSMKQPIPNLLMSNVFRPAVLRFRGFVKPSQLSLPVTTFVSTAFHQGGWPPSALPNLMKLWPKGKI